MTQNFDVFAKRKGQSAIEYLMTYGWMLLVVAIVGGAIFATVQGQCTASTSGFSTSDVRVADFGLQDGGNSIAFDLRNAAAQPVDVTNITITPQGASSPTAFHSGNAVDIAVGGSGVISGDSFNPSGSSFSSSQGCNTFDVTISYNVSGGIGNQQVTGTLTNSMQLSQP